jgi:hypothetical protein
MINFPNRSLHLRRDSPKLFFIQRILYLLIFLFLLIFFLINVLLLGLQCRFILDINSQPGLLQLILQELILFSEALQHYLLIILVMNRNILDAVSFQSVTQSLNGFFIVNVAW